MRQLPVVLLLALLAVPAAAQKRAAAVKEPTFPEALELAKKAFDGKEYGSAVSALQAAIRELQKLQRTAILAAMPKPAGFTFKDEERNDEAANPFAGGMSVLGLTVDRHYTKGDDKHIDIEVMANSPMVQMMAVMFSNPALVKADGGEIVEYGVHKAILKKNGDNGNELTILMYDKHVIKATSGGITVEELLAVIDQAMVDRMEKQLGK
ncbi:MAG TPA: hypothetical protein VK348_09260 [Planctomycetota bacterium]|nr:hypothetical protein [Planctomycetota bacterium]